MKTLRGTVGVCPRRRLVGQTEEEYQNPAHPKTLPKACSLLGARKRLKRRQALAGATAKVGPFVAPGVGVHRRGEKLILVPDRGLDNACSA